MYEICRICSGDHLSDLLATANVRICGLYKRETDDLPGNDENQKCEWRERLVKVLN